MKIEKSSVAEMPESMCMQITGVLKRLKKDVPYKFSEIDNMESLRDMIYKMAKRHKVKVKTNTNNGAIYVWLK